MRKMTHREKSRILEQNKELGSAEEEDGKTTVWLKLLLVKACHVIRKTNTGQYSLDPKDSKNGFQGRHSLLKSYEQSECEEVD